LDEFEILKARYLQAIEYWNSKYNNDTPEGKEWAEKQVLDIRKSIDRIWYQVPEDEKQKFLEEISIKENERMKE
jgi:hypothetical protein